MTTAGIPAAPPPPSRRPARSAIICAVTCALLFTILAIVVTTGHLTPADTRGILATRAYASPAVTRVMMVASLVGHGRVAIPVALAILVSLYALGRRADAALYAIACLGGEVVLLAVKTLVRQHRPVGISPKLTDAGFYSFPSGHTMLAVIIFGFGALLLTRGSARPLRVAGLAMATLIVLLIGAARVYLGAHWPSDVVGALLAGSGWAAVCTAIGSRSSVIGDR